MKYYIEQRADLRPTLEQIQWSERRYLSPRAAEILRAEQLPVVKRGGRGGRPLVLPAPLSRREVVIGFSHLSQSIGKIAAFVAHNCQVFLYSIARRHCAISRLPKSKRISGKNSRTPGDNADVPLA